MSLEPATEIPSRPATNQDLLCFTLLKALNMFLFLKVNRKTYLFSFSTSILIKYICKSSKIGSHRLNSIDFKNRLILVKQTQRKFYQTFYENFELLAF